MRENQEMSASRLNCKLAARPELSSAEVHSGQIFFRDVSDRVVRHNFSAFKYLEQLTEMVEPQAICDSRFKRR